MRWRTILGVGVALLVLAPPLLADDLVPPLWRGTVGSTAQKWEFLTPVTPGTPIIPDPVSGGIPPLPSTYLTPYPVPPYWIPEDPQTGRQGIVPLSGEMFINVDNYNIPNDHKDVWLQLTWQWQPGNGSPVPVIDRFNPIGTPVTIVSDLALVGGWHHTVYEWMIFPNPPDESFWISGDINVDQIVLDTDCVVPLPGAGIAGLALLGGLAVARMRRRISA